MSVRGRTTVALAVLAAVTLAAYGDALFAGFTNWDDPLLIVRNEAIRTLTPQSVLAFFTQSIRGTYLPVRALSYAADYRVWKLRPFGYHATNIALHVANVWLVFLVARRLLRRASWALLAATLFALHPTHTESVVWASGRKEVLSGFFLLLALWTYMGAVTPTSSKRPFLYVASLVAMIGASLSKPTAVTAPALFMLYDALFPTVTRAKSWPERAAHYAPFFLTGAVLLAIHLSMGVSAEVVKHDSGTGLAQKGIDTCSIWLEYWRLLAAPVGLCARHTFRSPSGVHAVLSVAAVAAWLAAVLALRRVRVACFALCWVAIALLPALNLIPVSAAVAERYLYVPMFGLSILAAWLGGRTYVWALGVAAMLWALAGIQQNMTWHSDRALWTSSVRRAPASPEALVSLAATESSRARADVWRRWAVGELRGRVTRNPSDADAWADLGKVLSRLRRIPEARHAFMRAVDIDPHFAGAHYNLAVIYASMSPPQAADARSHCERARACGYDVPSRFLKHLRALSGVPITE